MTPAELKSKFPNASESFIAKNCSAALPAVIAQCFEGNSLELKNSTDVSSLNKTERAYFDHLKAENYDWVGVQNITLKLAHDCRLTCDFVVLRDGVVRFIDVKGFQREDALIKMKVAARMFPWAQFQIVKRRGSEWAVQNIKP